MNRRPLSWFIWMVVAAGAVTILDSAFRVFHSPHPREWILFGILAILTGSFTLKVASIEASISVADTFFIASAMLFGPAPATMALAVDTLVLSWRKRHDGPRIAFNVAAPALSLWVATHIFFAVARVAPLSTVRVPIGPIIAPLLCLTTLYFVLNSGLIATAVGLDAGQSPFGTWRSHFMWLGVGYFAAASLAFCLTFIIQQIGLGAVAIILPVVITFHLTLRASFGRLEDAHRHVKQVDRLYTSTIETLAMAIDAKDDVTHNHVRRVQAYAKALARALGIVDELTLKAIDAAALLHDTGKLAVPERILNKPGGLTVSEFEQMKQHVEVGADILALVDFPYPVVPIVRCHHENWDGSGYPAGVAGSDIPIGARILSVVDCFDALTSDRPYRKALSDREAIEILLERRGRMYDPDVVDTFIAVYRDVVITAGNAHTEQKIRQAINRAHHAVHAPAAEAHAAAPVPQVADDVLAFVSLARLASGSGSLGDVLALATSLVQQVVPDTTGAWFVLAESGEHLTAAAAFGPGAAVLQDFTIGVGDRLTGWVASHRQVIINSSAALDVGPLAARIEPPLESCLSVPLCCGQRVVGVLTFYSSEHDQFNDHQGRLVQMIVPHIAQAIDAALAPASVVQPGATRDFKVVSRR